MKKFIYIFLLLINQSIVSETLLLRIENLAPKFFEYKKKLQNMSNQNARYVEDYCNEGRSVVQSIRDIYCDLLELKTVLQKNKGKMALEEEFLHDCLHVENIINPSPRNLAIHLDIAACHFKKNGYIMKEPLPVNLLGKQ